MAQKKDLNISPYYDDFDSSKNFHKVLFKPGFPVQARELTTLQSVLQNQIETFGSHMFKEGSMVIPGAPTYDSDFYSVKLNPTQFGIDITLYINQLLGKILKGKTSGISASVIYIALPDGNNVEDITIYVKYINSSTNDFIGDSFIDGESLIINENILYGNSTITAGSDIVTLIPSDATSTGSSVSVDSGIYFIRGYFANVNKQTIILDHYTNTPSYRVGLKIDESIIKAKDDISLYDNAKGFSNFAAPGADRFKIGLTLTKKLITDTNDTDFVEILRIENGQIKKITVKTEYNYIRDYLAARTLDESGSYAVNEFQVNLKNSLNDRLGSNGIYFKGQNTKKGNTPSDDLMCVNVSSGRAYVNGYDVPVYNDDILDVKKPRETEKITLTDIDFEMGNLLKVNNVSGQPQFRKTIELYDSLGSTGTKIGDARLYSIHLSDGSYTGASTQWNAYLYDIQTYTKLTLSLGASVSEIPNTTYVKGLSSGATGYIVSHVAKVFTLRQTSGSFMVGEQLSFNGQSSSNFGKRTITEISTYGARDIKSIKQTKDSSSYYQDF